MGAVDLVLSMTLKVESGYFECMIHQSIPIISVRRHDGKELTGGIIRADRAVGSGTREMKTLKHEAPSEVVDSASRTPLACSTSV